MLCLVCRVRKTCAQPTRKLRREKPSVNTKVRAQGRGMRSRIITKTMRIIYASHRTKIVIFVDAIKILLYEGRAGTRH